MAEQALEKLDEQLNCAICLDVYTEPKLLQCFHVYCKKCLDLLVVQDQQGQLSLTCPTCRKVTSIPDNGVSGLQSAFHISRILEIRESLDESIKITTFSEERMESGNREATSIAPEEERVILKCSEHTDKELELYCETCEKMICLKCVVKGGKHNTHDYNTLDEAFDKYQGEITSSLEPIEKQLTIINSALTQLDTRCEEISNQRAAVEDDIHNTFRQLHEILDVRKTELISELHQMTQGKLKDLATQRDQIETIQAQLSSSLNFMKESLGKGNLTDMMMMKNTIAKQVKELTATYCQEETLKPNTEADMTFLASSHNINALCQNYGKIIISEIPDPEKFYIKDMTEVTRVGEKTTSLLHAVNSRNKPCEVPIKSFECELVSEIKGEITKGSVERRGESQYNISYQPTMKGRHQLHIKVEGHHIRGSPFKLTVIGDMSKTIPIEYPVGVAIHQNGDIIVTSRAKHCVSIFSQSGKELQSFGTRGSAQGQFNYPSDVAVDDEGNILVADTKNYRIQKLTAGGRFLATVGTYGNGPLQFKYPSGIAFSARHNKVYVTDGNNHRIQVLNSDLTFSYAYGAGKSGSGVGEFNYPYGIACDSTGKVYVAEFGNHRIQVFTEEGGFLRMFGKEGQGKGELCYPIGVTVDASDRVYVCESGNHRVSLFTFDGEFLTSFGKDGKGPGEFNRPNGLAVDSSGVVYVCDRGNNRVEVF